MAEVYEIELSPECVAGVATEGVFRNGCFDALSQCCNGGEFTSGLTFLSDAENELYDKGVNSGEELSRRLDEIGPERIRECLKGYGAWDDTELSDDHLNRQRLVWVAACWIREDGTTNWFYVE